MGLFPNIFRINLPQKGEGHFTPLASAASQARALRAGQSLLSKAQALPSGLQAYGLEAKPEAARGGRQ